MIIIESNIPAPTRKNGDRSKYPFSDMKVGDSFWYKISNNNLLVQAKYMVKKLNKDWKFVSKTENEGTRIWRIK